VAETFSYIFILNIHTSCALRTYRSFIVFILKRNGTNKLTTCSTVLLQKSPFP